MEMFDPTVLFLGVIISSVGLALFIYGKKQARFRSSRSASR